jgi:hypothetical protein
MLVTIGSVALSERGIDLGRYPSDTDLVGDYDELIRFLKDMRAQSITPFDNGKKIVGRTQHGIYECEIAWPGSSSEALYNLVANDTDQYDNGMYNASLNVCYMLKMTHRFKKGSVHFLKTMKDIHAMRKLGAVIQPDHEEFYQRRLKETLAYSHPKLNQSKKEFFSDHVPYVYDHDSIHEAVKIYYKPAYSFFKEDESEVLTSKILFDKLPLAYRLAAVYEESCVLALERSQIPYPETPRDKSFLMALEKVCTSITSGWFREFAWEHYNEVVELYDEENKKDYNYVDVFTRTLATGNIIKPHQKD